MGTEFLSGVLSKQYEFEKNYVKVTASSLELNYLRQFPKSDFRVVLMMRNIYKSLM